MACYWGCGTKANKIVWLVSLFFILVGAVLLIAGGAGGADTKAPSVKSPTGQEVNCWQAFRECRDVFDNDICRDMYEDRCKLRTWVGLIIAGVIILLAGGIGPWSYFCCCSNAPNVNSSGMVTGHTATIPMAQPYPAQGYPSAVPLAQPYGTPVAQPYQPPLAQPYIPPGQPVQAQPYYPPVAGGENPK
mmetsp:Transcript_24421/g.53344  ORF Transcript_24421/g.53344 Transcript_24421/m.53344 type:complete len:189 (-) Transcript_24421:231-797(-)|eukprot:CAMPEP_0202894716 /NCGR_PEP_ID=MMETSP1392-20130828/4056_1 /ASSEMBLY_ACC=CAM_ASM_000868 /TAXON_ID=225041 /ORGANISM="Chlamydomonas chlamydogama, Strain SAG 11-48b" /LENGTH=188 /DNA_ID=CAMNT_0049579487 /DNA_START=1 /DNA_END=567 /DNA_ORIENTATION=+